MDTIQLNFGSQNCHVFDDPQNNSFMYLSLRIISTIKKAGSPYGDKEDLYFIDLKNFKIITTIQIDYSYNRQQEFVNKIYNGLGVQKYLK